jgi:peptidoglycan/LPS O-acetylase OafA/YrhL
LIKDAAANGYRPDVDGLRALAVLAVILFHIDPAWVPGGFVGVDVFFVISGYLITRIIAKGLSERTFTIIGFYDRRIRRILPALWVLLLVCLPVSWWLMLPRDVEAMAKSALWSILAMANVYYWLEVPTDYFASESAMMPFLHLWSLGVEEQFYLLWPLLLIALYTLFTSKSRARTIGLVLALLLVVCSTLLAERSIAAGQTQLAYYMLHARAGELAVGAALALAWPRLRQGFTNAKASTCGHMVALLGWGLLAVSLFGLSEHEPFPGWRALMPTFGAASIIFAGQVVPKSPLILPLTHRVSVWVGRSSYSAYLWHWPILAWWRYLWGQPGLVEGVGLLVLILLVAGVSLRYIEEPARRNTISPRRSFLLYLVLPAVVLAAMALTLATGERWGLRLYPEYQRQEWSRLQTHTTPVHRLDWVCQQQSLNPGTLTDSRCEFGGGDQPAQALLLGDSHAAHFAPVLRHAAETQGVRVRSVALGSCPALPGSLGDLVADSRRKACEHGMRQVLERAREFPLLIIGGSWASYAARNPVLWERLETHLTALVADGHRVWLLPRVSPVVGYDSTCPEKSVRTGGWLRCPTLLPTVPGYTDVNDRLADLATKVPGVRFLPLHLGLCQGGQCMVTDADGNFLYADGSHLSLYGAQYLAATLSREGMLPDLRQRD